MSYQRRTLFVLLLAAVLFMAACTASSAPATSSPTATAATPPPTPTIPIENGTDVANSAESGTPIIIWSQGAETGETACEQAILTLESVAFGSCGSLLMRADLPSEERAEDLAYFAGYYAPFTAETPAGKVEFKGQGDAQADPAEQRMIAEFARLVAQEAQAGRSGAAWGLIFAWHREGGIAGFCDDVTLYVSGVAHVSSCQSSQPQDLGRIRLSPAQLAAVYGWVDKLASFEFEDTDPAVADAMTVRLTFTGRGSAAATEAERQAMIALAAELALQASATPAP